MAQVVKTSSICMANPFKKNSYGGGTDAGFGYVDTPIKYQDARTYGNEAKALLVRTLSYLFQHDSGLQV